MKNGEYKKAFEICDAGIKLKKDEVSLNRLRFELLHKLKMLPFDEIKEEYEAYLTNFPKDSYLKLCYAALLYINKSRTCDKLFAELRYSDYMSFTDKLKVMYDVNRTINQEEFHEVGLVTRSTATGYYLKSERFNSKTLVFLSKFSIGEELKKMDRIGYKLMFNYSGGFAVEPKKLY